MISNDAISVWEIETLIVILFRYGILYIQGKHGDANV
jgi:hypothetical protein